MALPDPVNTHNRFFGIIGGVTIHPVLVIAGRGSEVHEWSS
jgi:hypothetical protein